MQVIPVLDIRAGTVVLAVRGERERYRPIESTLASGSRPQEILQAIDEKFRPQSVYIADLDALEGGRRDDATLSELAEVGPRLIVDVGVRSLSEALAVGALGVDVVFALETSPGPILLAELVGLLGPERVVFSLDLRDGLPLGELDPWGGDEPLAIVARAVEAGVRRVIVLDLARVGSGEGPASLELVRELHRAHAAVEIIAGGGVRSQADLEALSKAGARGVLVATALHNGSLES